MNGNKSLLKPILLDVFKKIHAWQATKARTKPTDKLEMSDKQINLVSSFILYMEHQIPAIKTRKFYIQLRRMLQFLSPCFGVYKWNVYFETEPLKNVDYASAMVFSHYFYYFESLLNNWWATISPKLATELKCLAFWIFAVESFSVAVWGTWFRKGCGSATLLSPAHKLAVAEMSPLEAAVISRETLTIY